MFVALFLMEGIAMANPDFDRSCSPPPADPNLPDILLVPGLHNSGPGHWQSIWEHALPRARRVDLGLWDDPHRNIWVGKLALAIGRAERPVVLVAHALGCHVVAWWAEYEAAFHAAVRIADLSCVVGALLVAPPDVEESPVDRRLTRFAPLPTKPLPFPSIVVASRDDPYATITQVRRVARTWGAQFVDAGAIGHANARSGLGEWSFGLDVLRQLAPSAVVDRQPPDPAALNPSKPLFQWDAAR